MAVYADISKCLLLQYTYREWLYEKKCDQWDCFSDVLRRFRMLTERGIEGQGLSRANLRAKSANVQRIFLISKRRSYNVPGKEQQWRGECVR